MINTVQLPHAASNQDHIVVRALSSITSEQADTIAQIVHASRHPWDIQAVDDYDGYQSILIEPATRSDEQKALFISGTAQRLELFEAQDDDLALIGTFADAEMLGARLARLL
jgi:hypothetical protein